MVEFSNPAAYERWMGRWSRRLAPSFVAFASFEHYWAPFLSNVTPTSSFAGTLGSHHVNEIERCLRQRTLGEAPDGPFSLKAYAWAVGGKLPD
jgi:hypothetical protein